MLDGEYTVTALDVEGTHPDFLGEGEAVYRNRFRCVPSSVAPRPKRPKRRPKPGMEVARVVGFIGGEIMPGLEANGAGYVRVRFRWDILDDEGTDNGSLEIGSATDDVYSVWLPVVQPWAGAGYGAQFIPREGMEVLVGFMEDQTERPVILGCLYSEANRPPWPEYVDHQKVGIRSQTRPADRGYSEVSIDDRHGGEVLQLRAQKDMREDVLNDRIAAVAHDRQTTIGHDDQWSVTHDRSIDIGGNDTRQVHGNDTRQVDGNDTLTVRGDEAIHVTGNCHDIVDGNRSHSVRRDLVTSVGGTEQRKVTGRVDVECADDVEGVASVSGSKEVVLSSDTALTLKVGKSCIRNTDGGIEITAADRCHARGGGASLALAKDTLRRTSRRTPRVRPMHADAGRRAMKRAQPSAASCPEPPLTWRPQGQIPVPCLIPPSPT